MQGFLYGVFIHNDVGFLSWCSACESRYTAPSGNSQVQILGRSGLSLLSQSWTSHGGDDAETRSSPVREFVPAVSALPVAIRCVVVPVVWCFFFSVRSLRVAVADSRWEFLNAAHLTYSEPEFLKC